MQRWEQHDLKRFFLRILNIPRFIKESIRNPYKILEKLILINSVSRFVPDKLFYSISHRAMTGMKANFKNPQSFNEKTLWLMLNDRKDWYWKIADKYEVRKFVADRIGEEYLVPLIGIYNSVDELNFDKLPDQFVLKCTHDSGTTVICEDKSKLNVYQVKKYLNSRLKRNYFWEHHEFPYKNIQPRIICEQFLTPDGSNTPNDYKFFCFHGVPKLIQVDTDRFIDHGRLTLFPDWSKAPFDIDRAYVKAGVQVEQPANLNEMLDVSARLSKDFKFIRVDLYSLGNKIYFGELTFYQLAGLSPIFPHSGNLLMGSWLKL